MSGTHTALKAQLTYAVVRPFRSLLDAARFEKLSLCKEFVKADQVSCLNDHDGQEPPLPAHSDAAIAIH